MGEQVEIYRDMRALKQEQGEERRVKNMRLLLETQLDCRVEGDVVLLREAGKPKVDFYSTTGKWRVPNENKGRICGGGGGAKRFIEWYEGGRGGSEADVETLKRGRSHRVEGIEQGQYVKSLDPRQDHCGWCIVCCPQCTKLMTIGRNHQVKPDGSVRPSLVCPHPPCTFHAFVHLENWNDDA